MLSQLADLNKNENLSSATKPQMQTPGRGLSLEYNHRQRMDQLDDINKTLVELRDELLQHQVRAHMLEVDLAMLRGPQVVGTMDEMKTSCRNCRDCMAQQIAGNSVNAAENSMAVETEDVIDNNKHASET